MADQPLESSDIAKLLKKLVKNVEKAFAVWDDVVFIGIRSGGEHIARHMVGLLAVKIGKTLPLGALDIALYRDDLSKRLLYPEVRRTDIPFDVHDKIVILVDDVLNTGRSVRAAIDHIVDLGRPRRIYLLVLFDRGGRELPIQADFVGKVISLPPDKIIKINIPEDKKSVGDIIITEEKR